MSCCISPIRLRYNVILSARLALTSTHKKSLHLKPIAARRAASMRESTVVGNRRQVIYFKGFSGLEHLRGIKYSDHDPQAMSECHPG